MNAIKILPLLLFVCTAALGEDKTKITVKLTVPDSAWTIAIEEVHQVKNEVWVISKVSRDPNVMGLQVLSTMRDTVKASVPDLPIKHFVVGKTWDWKNGEPYTFLKNLKSIEKDLKSAKLLYKRTNEKKKD